MISNLSLEYGGEASGTHEATVGWPEGTKVTAGAQKNENRQEFNAALGNAGATVGRCFIDDERQL